MDVRAKDIGYSFSRLRCTVAVAYPVTLALSPVLFHRYSFLFLHFHPQRPRQPWKILFFLFVFFFLKPIPLHPLFYAFDERSSTRHNSRV